MSEVQKIAVIGAGSWGTALSMVLAKSGAEIILWTPVEAQAKELRETRRSGVLCSDSCLLDQNIFPTSDLESVKDAELFVIVVPSVAMRSVAERLQGLGLRDDAVFVSCTKGIEQDSLKLMTEVLEEYFPGHDIGVLSGPNHAEDICRGLPSATLIGFKDMDRAVWAQRIFTSPIFRVYSSTDIIGMQIGGTVKNVFAIASGLCAGLNLGDNAQAALVTRGLAEMTRIGVARGGLRDTFMGLSGMGDLVVTCYSNHSRNQNVGKSLAAGKSLQETLDAIGMVAEGVPNTLSSYRLARALDVRTPLIDTMYAILYQNKQPLSALTELMSRDLRNELD